MNRVTTYRTPTLTIATKRRPDDWIAYADGDRRRSESGATEAEAIGKLVISESANAAPPPPPSRRLLPRRS